MAEVNKAELLQLAQHASQGDWQSHIDATGEFYVSCPSGISVASGAVLSRVCEGATEADAAYIAALSPDVVRALIAACTWVAVAERLPASGRTVLAFYLNSVGRVRRIRAQYVERWTIEVDAATADPDTECVEYSESADAFYLLEGWYECIDNWDAFVRIAVTEGQVSHWMPLPAAPVDSTVKESLSVQPVTAAPDDSLTAAVDAAMVEMQNISPPLRRGECERLIRAALSVLCVQQGGDA